MPDHRGSSFQDWKEYERDNRESAAAGKKGPSAERPEEVTCLCPKLTPIREKNYEGKKIGYKRKSEGTDFNVGGSSSFTISPYSVAGNTGPWGTERKVYWPQQLCPLHSGKENTDRQRKGKPRTSTRGTQKKNALRKAHSAGILPAEKSRSRGEKSRVERDEKVAGGGRAP